MLEKQDCRRAIRDRLSTLSENDRRVESAVIVRHLRDAIDHAQTIAGFMPYADEPNILPLMEEILQSGKTLCIPQVIQNRLVMKEVHTLNISRNPLTGIPDPIDGNTIDEATIDCVIVPGRAFMKTGERMGRGNGGYDYWIHAQRTRNPKTVFLGVCFECQLMTSLPMEAHDEHVDMVITSR